MPAFAGTHRGSGGSGKGVGLSCLFIVADELLQVYKAKQEITALRDDKEKLWGELVKLDRRVLNGQEGVNHELRELAEEVERTSCRCGLDPSLLPDPGADGIWDHTLHYVNSDMLADESESDREEERPILSLAELRAVARQVEEEEEEVATLMEEEEELAAL